MDAALDAEDLAAIVGPVICTRARMLKCLWSAALAVAALGITSHAFATDCEGVPAQPDSLVIDPSMVAAVPPPAPQILSAFASDGDSGECSSGPYLYLAVSDPPEIAGVRVEVAAGRAPARLDLSGQPYALLDEELMWRIDDADDVDFVLRLTSLDGAGNPGGSVDTRIVERDEGCSFSGGGSDPWLVALSLVAFRSLRDRRRSGPRGRRSGTRA